MSQAEAVLLGVIVFGMLAAAFIGYKVGHLRGYSEGVHKDWSRPQQKKGGGDL